MTLAVRRRSAKKAYYISYHGIIVWYTKGFVEGNNTLVEPSALGHFKLLAVRKSRITQIFRLSWGVCILLVRKISMSSERLNTKHYTT